MSEGSLSNSKVLIVIGIVVASVLLLTLGGLFSLGSIGANDVKERTLSSKDKLLKLEKKLVYTEELGVTYKENQFKKSQVEEIERKIASKRNEIQKNEEALKSIKLEIKEVEESFYIYKNKYKLHVRSSAVGEKLSELTLLSGKTYKDVVIKKVDDLEFVVSNKYGSQAFRYDELPSKFRERFQASELVAKKMLSERTSGSAT
ncbi:hypothetical protein OAI07_02305, partial [Akkermansiaceae bacterium]|nr:hypothetical protein [Akkermansiaceae bacterium]